MNTSRLDQRVARRRDRRVALNIISQILPEPGNAVDAVLLRFLWLAGGLGQIVLERQIELRVRLRAMFLEPRVAHCQRLCVLALHRLRLLL